MTDRLIAKDRIIQLSSEAGSHGDLAMVEICQQALGGDVDAVAEVARVLSESAAMADRTFP